MNIVIPMVGKSRRFNDRGYRSPKYLLPLAATTVIEAVMDCFAETDDFYLIVASDQVSEAEVVWLRGLRPSVTVLLIEPHDLGPVHSCVIAPIDFSGPAIISYCDFLVDWDYRGFLNFAQEFDAAVPTFSGFHPASFGDTKYAYCKIGDKCRLLEIREKESFTNAPWSESASTGAYYFKSWSLFLKYAGSLVSAPSQLANGEYYVTGVIDKMLRDRQAIGVSKVDKFICLGTPEDYEQYRYWSRAVNRVSHPSEDSCVSIDSDLLITMAGQGTRFSGQGYRVPKPLIPVEGKPLFVQAALSMPKMSKYYFTTLCSVDDRYDLRKLARLHLPDSNLITLEAVTDGQLSTAAQSISSIEGDRPLFVASADYLLFLNPLQLAEVIKDENWDFIIVTARSPRGIHGDYRDFAYCRAPNFPRIEKVVEKSLVSDEPWNDHIVTGTFLFRSKSLLAELSQRADLLNLTVNDEKYIANALNVLLDAGFRGLAVESDLWVSLGTPFELELFNYWNEYFSAEIMT